MLILFVTQELDQPGAYLRRMYLCLMLSRGPPFNKTSLIGCLAQWGFIWAISPRSF